MFEWRKVLRVLSIASGCLLVAAMSLGFGCDDGATEVTLPPVVAGPPPPDNPVCEPRQWSCLSLGEEAQCDYAGGAYNYTRLCPEGESCSSEGPGRCLPKVCDTGTRRCRSDTVTEICGPQGDVWVEDADCGAGYLCNQGRCTLASCMSRVLFVIDRSGSMSPNWTAVRNATVEVIAGNPIASFGLVGFPRPGSFCATPAAPSVPLTTFGFDAKLDKFFSYEPFGNTPLVSVLQGLKSQASTLFGEQGGAVVVLTDGYDTCAEDEERTPLAMAALATELKEEHNLSTYVIGYEIQGFQNEGLTALASNGGTGYTNYIPAGTEKELADVFTAIVSDWKLCF